MFGLRHGDVSCPPNVGADANEFQSLGSKYGVQGFPTIKVFGAKKSSPTNYEGPRTAAGIVDFALKVGEPPRHISTSAGT